MIKRVRNSKLKKFNNKMQAKLLLVFCILLIGLVALVVRLIVLNRGDGDKYKKRVLSQQTYNSKVIPYKRGDIVDRKGTVLATSQKVYNVILDVKKLIETDTTQKEKNEKRREKGEEVENVASYMEATLDAITLSFPEITREDVDKVIASKANSQYVILHKKISYEEVEKFKELEEAENSRIIGVWFEEDYLRSYPYNSLASSILGFTVSGNQGSWGLEQFYNEDLNGSNGREYGYIDEELKLERTVKPAVNGHTIVSTIDANVQGKLQEHIKIFNEEIGSKNIGVIVMNPNNGEVLAMASNDEYNLNKPMDLSNIYTQEEIDAMTKKEKEDALYSMWRNFAISDAFEPGSTFKPFTIAGALDEGLTHQHEEFFCDGHEVVGGWLIRCSNRAGHKNINLMESLMQSCNDVLMELVKRTGKNLFYRYQTFFGFGSKTGIDLPGEASGLLVEEEKITSSDLATSSFGQTFTTTMIQMATGYSSLVNGGYYYEPHMVKEILNDKNGTVKTIDKVLVKDTVTKSTSDFINESMYQTVEAGTAGGAKVPGYKVGGKTGTAQKYPRADRTYVVSFIGAVPADDPEIVIYVVVDEPQNVVKQADSSIATKFASRILTDILPFLELYPTENIGQLDSNKTSDGDQGSTQVDIDTNINNQEVDDLSSETTNSPQVDSEGENNSNEEDTSNENVDSDDDYLFIPEGPNDEGDAENSNTENSNAENSNADASNNNPEENSSSEDEISSVNGN